MQNNTPIIEPTGVPWRVQRTISIGNIIQIAVLCSVLFASYFRTQSRVDHVEGLILDHLKNHESFVRSDVQAVRDNTNADFRIEILSRLTRLESKMDQLALR